jgi:hypothetical protein
MSGRTKFSLGIGALALIAILAVAVPKIDVGGDDSPEPAAETESQQEQPEKPAEPEKPEKPAEPAKPTPPSSPDDVKGNEERSLTRPANFRKALAVLERKRRSVEGVFDGLRVAPGRIDTTVETKSRRMTLQVRTDFKIGFATDSEFPNRPDFRRYGIVAKDVDVRAPAQILERIDGVRKGASAARDVDYIVIRRDIIDFMVNLTAFLRSGPPPRAFSLQPGEQFRAIG